MEAQLYIIKCKVNIVAQKGLGSVTLNYKGNQINKQSELKYLINFRNINQMRFFIKKALKVKWN